MSFSLRLLPLTIIVLALLLGVKVGDLLIGFNAPFGRPLLPLAVAMEPIPQNGLKPTPKTAEVKSEEGPSLRDQGTFSRAEQELMSDLQARRASLEERSQELDNRESLLSAAEKRIDDKLAELKKLQAAQTSAAAQVAEGGSPADKSLQSLVKVYETMKPKDAARIFDKLDMPVLISVVKQMKEAKIAAVLAEMDNVRAQKVTVELAGKTPVQPASAANAPPKPAGGKS